MPSPAIPIIDKALAIWHEWQKSRPMAKLRYRVDAAIHYVLVAEKEGEFSGLAEEERKKLLKHYRKRIFDE